MKCLGYGEFKGKCQEPAGTPWSPYWCERCNQLRMAKISASLEDIVQRQKERQ